MALQLGRAVSDGIRRVFTRTGGILFVGLLAIQLLTQTAVNSAVLGFLPSEAMTEFAGSGGLALPVSGSVGLALFGVTSVLGAVYFVVLSRAFAQPFCELSTFPAGYADRLGRATFSAVIGGIVVSISVGIGTVLLFLPGIFLAASFMFFIFAISVEDRGIYASLKRSWGLARGSRLKLSLLVILSAVFGGIVGGVAPVLDLAGLPLVADLATVVLSTVFFLPFYAIVASAYLQVRDDPGGGGGSETIDPVETSQMAEL